MRRTRFLLSFLAWASGLSGGDRHALEMATRWGAHVDIEVVAPPEARETISSYLGDVPFRPVGTAGASAAARGPGLALEYVRRAAATRRLGAPPDAVIATSHFLPDAAAVASASANGAAGVAYVYHLIRGRRSRSPRTLWSKFDEAIALQLLHRHASVVFSCNEETRLALARSGFSPTHTDVGIDVSAFEWRRDPPEAVLGLFLARLMPSKGVLDAVRAWRSVVDRHPEAHLIFAGDGPERARGEGLAHDLGLHDSISWRGFVEEEEKRELLASSRLLLAPSYEEGWGISVCEALASGVAVVAYRLPTLDEVFGDTYVGVPPGDVEALAGAVNDILSDRVAAAELAARGRARAERYDLGRVAEVELERILAAVAAR